MDKIQLQRRRQHGGSKRYVLGIAGAAVLAAALIAALHFSAARGTAGSLDHLPPTAALAPEPSAAGSDAGGASVQRRSLFSPGEATFHEGVDFSALPVEPDPSERAVAAYAPREKAVAACRR